MEEEHALLRYETADLCWQLNRDSGSNGQLPRRMARGWRHWWPACATGKRLPEVCMCRLLRYLWIPRHYDTCHCVKVPNTRQGDPDGMYPSGVWLTEMDTAGFGAVASKMALPG